MIEMIRYDTMNSWNQSTAPAFNLKVYNVVPHKYRDKVFELMDADGFYDEINFMIEDFQYEHDYQWQAGFNGRSGGYLVLYQGGYKKIILYPSKEFKRDNGYSGQVYADGHGWKSYYEAKKAGLLNKEVKRVFCWSGKGIETEDVPADVLKSFTKLADGIVKHTIDMAKTCEVKEETYSVQKTRKVIV